MTPITILFFIVTVIASCVGTLSGMGPGVIIKPVFDSFGLLSVSVVSFLSGCTVLAMSFMALLKSKKSSVKVDLGITPFLAIGASIGGVLGKQLFILAEVVSGNEKLVGLVQTIILLFANIFMFIYLVNKSKIQTKSITNWFISIIIGLLLGMVSSFLGIGGGPFNIIALLYFYSMPPKETALNSIFIMLFSQLTSLLSMFVTKSIPPFDYLLLILMCIGGFLGALAGGAFSKKISEKALEIFFMIVLVLLVILNIYNVFLFLNIV